MSEGENLSKHAAEASKRALEMAGIQAADVDLILLATSTPDDLFGSAGQVHNLSTLKVPSFPLLMADSAQRLGTLTSSTMSLFIDSLHTRSYTIQ